ncbi:MAG TPA: hypothetical protein VHX38_03575 [Pseudonocardiaceae bacterium]|jgi:hypothetical protein|nr:hypothetical protein [Pseudonocardiaceae bacterium]
MDAQAIYDNFHTHAQGTPGLATAQQTAEQLAAKYQDHAVATQQLIDGVQVGWKGVASEAAAQGLTPLAVSSLDTHQQLTSGQDIVGRQVDSFHTAVSEVQPVPPAPTMQNVITAAVAGQDTTPMIDQMAHSYAAQASNVDAYSKYVSASQYNTSNLPPITPVDTPNAPVSVTTPPPAATSKPSATTHAPQVSAGSASRTSATRVLARSAGSGSNSSLPSVGNGGPTPPAASTGNGSTTTSSATSPVVPPPSQSPPAGPSGGSVPGQTQPVGPVGAVGGVSGDGGGMGTGPGLRTGPGAVNEDVGGLGGVRSGAGNSGGRGLASGTNSGGGAAGDEEGTGSRSGASPGSAGVAEEEALAAERGAGSGGITSSSAAPMGGARGTGGGKDSEHQRKYGVEEDGEELFGFSGRLAPPVMGETPAEREQRHEEEAGRHRGEP